MSTGTPYIGSKISLVSKAKIRYEGFLYTIDQNESTVTLAKVKSLGTEDRCPNDPVPAREEIFEYIVFRGHDIDDLHVSEAPKQQQQMSDPAIAHSGPIQQTQNYPNHPNQFPSYGHFGGMPNMGYPQFPNRQPESLGNRQTPPMLPRTPTPEPPKTTVHDERSQKEQKSRSDSNRSTDRKNSSEFRNKGGDRPNDNYHRYSKDNRRDNRESRNYRDNRDTDKKEQSDKKKEHNKDNRYISRDNNTKDQRKDDRDRREHGDKNERNSTDRRRGGATRVRGNRGGNRQSRGGNTREKFTEDFDFETSNAKFNKEEIEKELLKAINKVKIEDDQPKEEETKVEEKDQDDSAPLPSPDQFYDRSKSFFDNISCEAMGGKAAPQKPTDESGVMTRRQERSLNMETFGQTAGYYRRGGYRGRGNRGGRGRGRGRGGYRGRGNYNRGSSNRNWVDYEFDYEAAGIKSQQAKVKAGS